MAEIVALQDHVVEFEEGHRLLALEPQAHGIEGQHPVDGEMRPDLLQHLDIAKPAQPVVIVDHHRIGRPVAENEQALEHRPDPGDILVDRGIGQHLAAFVAPRGVADPRGPAAHQHDRLVPCLLQPPQHHDLHEAADMERRRGGIETDIARHDLLGGERIEALGVGDLVDIAALVEHAQEIGGVVAHDEASASR